MKRYLPGSLLFLFVFMSGIHLVFAVESEGEIDLPFKVAGTVINSSEESVLIEMTTTQEEKDKETASSEHWFHEGDSVQGFDLVKIDKDKVTFERDGQTLHVMVGYGRASKENVVNAVAVAPADRTRGKLLPPHVTLLADFPASQDKEIQIKFIPAPENVEDFRIQAQAFLDKLYRNPDFTQKAQILRTRLLQQRQDSALKDDKKASEIEHFVK
ncbi:MAG: hypothetical protein ACE5DY_04440 [Mariprofundaceae bacterium]